MESSLELIKIALLKKRVILVDESISHEFMDWVKREIHLMVNNDSKKDIYLLIDTFGGKSNAGLVGRDLLKAIPVKSIGIVNGACKSTGLELLSGCSEKLSLPNSKFFFHYINYSNSIKEEFNFEEGAQELKNDFNNYKLAYYEAYQDGFGLTAKQIKKLTETGEKYSRHYSAQEMLKLGVIDKIITNLPFYFPEKKKK